ncbi:threonine/homoserine/homoserine lactone efflux protein [Flavobacteriaceae bacterium MAR_2009_75]|nr:threonine/homoserine/homoserine lactone efflux protein [Flavobacteriaceae bacterium MAR_2009_75]
MNILSCILFGFLIAASGSIVPSFLNMTVVKFSLRCGSKSAFYLIAGFATVLFFQANIGAYLSNVLMKNSEHITLIQQIGTGILLILSLNFFRLHFFARRQNKKEEIDKSKAYLHGIGMSLLNTFAIPFYFTSISILISMDLFTYSITNSLYFSIGSTVGSFSLYSLYAMLAGKVEKRITSLASKMDLILGCLTGVVGIGNFIYLI